ncbi:MAG TPA: AraC family transcriptional regulator [Burkholderiales bacterium]|jgi:AraC family transcriptional regulator|nr:AraC family transcriptional regulator [Burkholderiales bacterium]
MNAPYDLAVVQSQADCLQRPSEPVDAASIRPDSVRVSSRPLGWKPLNVERRELEPGSDCLPGGVTEHLIFVSLADGHVIRESGGDIADKALEAGLVSIHPADTPVRWEWDTRLSFTMMSLDPEYFSKVAQETFDLDPARVRLQTVEGRRDPVITSIAGTLLHEVMTGDAGSRLYAESLATLLSVHLLRNYSDQPQPEAGRQVSQPRAVVQALNFIHQNYAMDISLADIAGAAHLSTYHLTRVFKKGTGVTPHQYLVQVRVNSARHLLTAGAGDRSLAEIASAVGFADQSHLTRHFKRLLGVTPKQLRQ